MCCILLVRRTVLPLHVIVVPTNRANSKRVKTVGDDSGDHLIDHNQMSVIVAGGKKIWVRNPKPQPEENLRLADLTLSLTYPREFKNARFVKKESN